MPRYIRKLQNLKEIDEEELLILKKRVDIATAVIILFVALLITRLWYLQIHKGEEYSKLSENNRIRTQLSQAPRGNILDRHGRIIVTNRPYFNIVWIKEDAPDPEAIIRRLSHILKEDIPTLLTRIREAAGRPLYVPIMLKEDIDWQTLVYIENHHLELPGIRVEAVPSRDYLYDNLASHLIGYIGEISKIELQDPANSNYLGGDPIGKMGIEKVMEKELRGEKGHRYLEVDVHGFEQQELKTQDPLPGNDLQLTLDIDLQKAAETALEGLGGAIVAMEVHTGRLLALASSPPLQIKEFVGGISTKVWKEHMEDPLKPLFDKTIQGQYPPGSTYKIITAAAGLAENIITPQTIDYCSGSIKLHGRRYGCWKRSGHGAITLERALSESCDVYFYHVGQKLGIDKLATYAESFGLGKKTGISLENEKGGLVPTTEWKKKKKNETWQEGETLSASIGQGFNLTTPLQVCNMTASLVNGGKVLQPQIIESIKTPDGDTIRKFTPNITSQVLGSEKDRKVIMQGLVTAVNKKHGTGLSAKLDTITVAGKTGTSQVVKMKTFQSMPEDELPRKYRDHAWFTCYAPAENPEIALTVLVEHGGHGGSAAAPIAKTILEVYFKNKLLTKNQVESSQ